MRRPADIAKHSSRETGGPASLDVSEDREWIQ